MVVAPYKTLLSFLKTWRERSFCSSPSVPAPPEFPVVRYKCRKKKASAIRPSIWQQQLAVTSNQSSQKAIVCRFVCELKQLETRQYVYIQLAL